MHRPFHIVLPLCTNDRDKMRWLNKNMSILERQMNDHTYLVASLPFKGDLAQTHMHNVVIGFGCAAHLANNIALSQCRIALLLNGADGSVYHLHWILTCSCVYQEKLGDGSKFYREFNVAKINSKVRFCCMLLNFGAHI